MTTRQSDFTPTIDLVAEPGTGPVRTRRPVYVDLLPPCNHACPAGENIQVACPFAGRSLPRGVADAGQGQPAAGRPRAGLLSPV